MLYNFNPCSVRGFSFMVSTHGLFDLVHAHNKMFFEFWAFCNTC